MLRIGVVDREWRCPGFIAPVFIAYGGVDEPLAAQCDDRQTMLSDAALWEHESVNVLSKRESGGTHTALGATVLC